MAKTTAWTVTVIGVLLALPLLGVDLSMYLGALNDWLIPLGVLIIGVTKLMRNYSKKRK